jgi:hypothetical protein
MSEECNGQCRSAAQSGRCCQIGPACIGRERHYWPPSSSSSMQLRRGRNALWSIFCRDAALVVCLAMRAMGLAGIRGHTQRHSRGVPGRHRRILVVDSRFDGGSHTLAAYVGRAPTCQASVKACGAMMQCRRPNEGVANTSGQDAQLCNPCLARRAIISTPP